MSRKSEREAAKLAAEIVERASRQPGGIDADYGTGKLTKHQKKSQERHIPLTERSNTIGARLKRAWID